MEPIVFPRQNQDWYFDYDKETGGNDRENRSRTHGIWRKEREGNVEKQAGDPHEERKRNVEGGLKSKWAREDRSTDRNAQ